MEIATEQPQDEPGLPRAGGDLARADPQLKPMRPKVGTAVMVARPQGPGAIPVDLEGSGFEVVVATDAGTALEAAKAGRADLAIVDLHFEGDGLGFCDRLWGDIPGFPVLLIGPNDENLVTKALATGADDYLVLPLRPAELVARVRAVLRRTPRWGGPPGATERTLQVGEVRLDPESHEVSLRNEKLHLPLREFELLRLLMENAGIVLPRTMLISRLWGPSAPLDSTSLEVHIRRLRSKLEDDHGAPRRIVTVRGIGYRYQVER